MSDESDSQPLAKDKVPKTEPVAPSPTRTSNASSARARAEARRRRILEKSKDRMSVVTGQAQSTNITSNENVEGEDKSVKSPDGSDGKEEGRVEKSAADNDAASDVKEDEVKPGMGSAARRAQMRRRRYKKAVAANDTDKNSIEGGGGGEGADNTTESVEKKKEEDEDKAATKHMDTKEGTGGSEGDKAPSEKKKYLGVVKMRRKMLAEKKASESQVVSSGTSASSVTSKKLKSIKKEKNVVTLRPIIVQFVTVVLLFLSGFDVGIQNHIVVNQDVPIIHTNYSLSDHGIGALKLVGKNVPSQRPKDSFNLNHANEEEFVDTEEEFGEVKPIGASTTSKKEPNIDPLFKVDLDEITAGNGILFTAARMAVSCHRFVTHIFFTIPLAFISGLFTLPKRIFVNPPILFLCAVLIRYLGKHVLGGSLPDLDTMIEAEINESDALKGKEGAAEGIANTDFVSMGANFVKNFFKTKFPMAVMFVTIFKDARSDMFVIFCGFFLGLVVPSNMLGHIESSSVSEEL